MATGRSKTQSAGKCYRCLGDHLANACKFRTAECYVPLLKVGHIAKACKSKQKGKKSQQSLYNYLKSNHYVEEDDVTIAASGHNRDVSHSSYDLFTVEGYYHASKPQPAQAPVEMEVDIIAFHQQSYTYI